jgi:hypothetical protein
MEISIKSSAEMAKVSRNTIYQAIKDGRISRSASGKVESSEILRVFGNPAERHNRQEEKEHIEQLKNTLNTEQKTEQSLNTLNTEKEELYKSQIKILEEALSQAHEREKWQQGHIEKLADTIKLLEAPKAKQVGFWHGLFRKKDFR